MAPLKAAVTAIGIAMTVARHPAVRAAMKAAPLLVTPRMREMAQETALDTAYRAGALARKVVRRD